MKKIYNLLLLGGLLFLGVSNAWGGSKTIYLDYSNASWWCNDNSAKIHAWGGASEQDVAMTGSASNIANGSINDDQKNILFYRYYGDAWHEKTVDIAIQNGYFSYKISSSPSDGKYTIDGSGYATLDAHVIFDNSNANWANVMFWLGRENYTGCYSAANITNTKLKYYHIADWYTYNRYRFVNAESYDSGNFNMNDGSHNPSGGYSGVTTNDFIDDKVNLFTFNGTNGSSLTKSEKAAITDLNSNQTVAYAIRTDGDYAAMSSGDAIANISIRSFKFAAGVYSSVSASDADLAAGDKVYSATVAAARTATTTLHVSNITNGYFFMGWYDALNGGTLLESGDTYTYYPTAEKTVYARFQKDYYPVTVGATEWASLYLPAPVAVPGSCTAYYVSDVTDNTATLVAISTIPANTGVIINATANTYNFYSTTGGSPVSNMLRGITATTLVSEISEDLSAESKILYVLGLNSSSEVGFYRPSASVVTLAPYKAYLATAQVPNQAPGIRFVIGDATNINHTDATEEVVKFIQNGKLLIKKNGVVYDMMGAVVK